MNEKEERELVKEIQEDFEARREARLKIERGWQLNMNFVSGLQYCDVGPDGELFEEGKRYYWQSKRVFNHIAPIVDSRIAKLEKMHPMLTVRPASDEESDIRAAELAKGIVSYAQEEGDLDGCITQAIAWSEICGTAFYKVLWNNDKGMEIGTDGERSICEGCTEIVALSPFEVYPDDLSASGLGDVESLIHAKAMSVKKIYEIYGVEVEGRDISEFSLSPFSAQTGNSAMQTGGNKNEKKDHEIVIERYTRADEKHKNGRVEIVAGNKVLYIGELPYRNGKGGQRDFPFVMQKSLSLPGCFYGGSIVERLIPLQRAYNAVRNRKHEFMNRLTMGVVAVEDGSVDTEELEEEGLSPGKILVYRQGSTPPDWLKEGEIPAEFSREEERLEEEFLLLGETNEFSRNASLPANVTSATGLKILLEQYNEKMGFTKKNIECAVKEIGRQILRLFKQFSPEKRLLRYAGNGKSVQNFYFSSSDIFADDVIVQTEERSTPENVRNNLMQLLELGLLTDAEGKITEENKNRILTALGFASFAATKDLTSLHEDKARDENISFAAGNVETDVYDDHEVHIREHIRYLLSEEFKNKKDVALKERILLHLEEHKKQIVKGE